METVYEQLREYAEELHRYYSDSFRVDEYEEFLRNIYEAQRRTHGDEELAHMGAATILKVIKMQVKEMIRVKSLPRLIKQRDRI